MPDGGRFEGRVAVVTGAGSGVGKATAELIAGEGGAVAALDIAQEPLQKVVDEITAGGGTAIALQSDVSSPDSVAATINEIVSRLGAPRVVCNVAGIGKFAH